MWVDRLEALAEEAKNRDPSEYEAVVADIEDVLTRVEPGSWTADFMASIRDQAMRRGSRLSPRQQEVFEKIKAEHSQAAMVEKAEWATEYCQNHIEDAKIIARYYNGTPYFTDAANSILNNDSYVPSVNLFNKMCKNRYAQKVLAASRSDAKYPVGTSIIVRRNMRFLKNGGVVLSVNEPIVSATKGCKRYKVLPYDSATPILVEERDIKLFKRKK